MPPGAAVAIDSLTPPPLTAVGQGHRRSIAGMSAPVSTVSDAIQAALATVNDPEIRRPITELGMVRSAEVGDDGVVRVELLLTVAGCPLKDKLRSDITAAVGAVSGVTGVAIEFGVMSPEQRQELQAKLRGGGASQEPVIPFAQPGSAPACTRSPAARAASASPA